MREGGGGRGGEKWACVANRLRVAYSDLLCSSAMKTFSMWSRVLEPKP